MADATNTSQPRNAVGNELASTGSTRSVTRFLSFGSLPILVHVTVGPFLMVVAVALIAGASAIALQRIEATNQSLREAERALELARSLTQGIPELDARLAALALAGDAVASERYLNRFADYAEDLHELKEGLAGHELQLAQVLRLQQLVDDWVEDVARPVVDLTRSQGSGSTLLGGAPARQGIAALQREANGIEAAQQERVALQRQELQDTRAAAGWWLAGSSALPVFAFVLALVVGRRISSRVGKLKRAAESIAGGNLDERMSVQGTNELEQTARAFNTMAAAIADAQSRMAEANRRLASTAAAADQARGTLQAIVDTPPGFILLLAPDGRIGLLNLALREVLGLDDPAALVGEPVSVLRKDFQNIFADGDNVLKFMEAHASDTRPRFTHVVHQVWPQQRTREIHTRPVKVAGEQFGRLFTFRDVTQEHEIDRMKSEFVSLVSHELRTPLTSIKGYVDLLIEREVGDITDEQEHFLTIVKNNADRLMALINDLLDISRIESGKIELKKVPLDMADLVQQVGDSLRPQIAAKQQQLALKVPGDLPPAMGDLDRVLQILTNLVSNAHKYTPSGGLIEVTAVADDAQMRVSVRDTGIGMTPEEQAQVFTKFFRARNRTTEEVGGTGLGLAITRSLVEMLSGTLSFQSTPDAGTTFTFTLPLTAASSVASSPIELMSETREQQPVRTGTGARILVIDDEPDIARLLQRYLERAGYQVAIGHTATDALRLAREFKPHLVTLDVVLPDADGYTVLEWLKQDPETREIPVVLVSILPDDKRGATLGAEDHLTKPVQEEVLLRHVGDILASSSHRQRILIADDEPDIRALLTEQLRRAGYDVLVAADGEEALQVAQEQQPDLVLLDVNMPRLDGISVLKALRSNEDTRDLPVVLMTADLGAYDGSRFTIATLRGGALLFKPTPAADLVNAIERTLMDHRA